MGSSSPNRKYLLVNCTPPHGHLILQIICEVGNHFKLEIIVSRGWYDFGLVKRHDYEVASLLEYFRYAIQILGDLIEKSFRAEECIHCTLIDYRIKGGRREGHLEAVHGLIYGVENPWRYI